MKTSKEKTMLSRSYASKEEFVREYKMLYCEKSECQQLYLSILMELEKAIAQDDIESLKKLSTLIEYASDLDAEISLRDYCVSTDNPIRSTNLIIFASKHNRVQILEYLLDSDSKVLNNLSVGIGKTTALPTDEDEAHHNAFYYAIRSENIQLLDIIINYFAVQSEELEEILSEVYRELKLKNVPLSDKMQVFVEHKLIDLGFFSTGQHPSPNTDDKIAIKKRIELLHQSISLLQEDYSNTEKVDGKLLFVVTFIAQTIHILKGRLRSHYNKIPWEEMEFCLVMFVSSQTKLQELNLFYRAILNKRKILNYLENFANELSDIEKITEGDKLHLLPRGKGNTREEIVAKIVSDCPQFKELYNDYHQIRDIYSLRRINDHVNLAISADVEDNQGQLIIVRVLQVIGEHLKTTLESPKLSQNTKELLEISLPQNAKKIITELRDSISHAETLSQILAIEKRADHNFFINIQNDLKKIAGVITDILYTNRIKTIRILFKKLQDSETLDEINEVLEELTTAKLDNTGTKNFKTIEHGKLENLVKELSDNIADKTNYEKELFKKLNNAINCSENQIENVRSDYFIEFLKLQYYSREFNYNKTDQKLIEEIKHCANNRLDQFTPAINPGGFTEIVNLSQEIFRSVQSRIQSDKFDEIRRLMRKISYIVEFETGDIKWIEDLREKLPKRKQPILKLTPEDLKQKLDELTCILNKNLLNEFKSDKRLQTVLKMLVLDVMVILEQEDCLENNKLFLDLNAPLLHGKCLRNYLAHDNAVVDVLLSDPLIAIMLNAEKLTKENIMESKKKIGKLVGDDPDNLKKNFERDLDILTNQERMFLALKEGNPEVLWDCLNKGADIKARSAINSWTTLHFAAKGSSLEVIKFILDQNLNVSVKDNNGQTPLHIAAAHGRQNIVDFFLRETCVCVDDLDIKDITPLHVAAQEGHKGVVEILLKHKAQIGMEDAGGCTPLYYAIRNNRTDVAKVLLENDLNFDINEAMGGSTALHIAASHGYLELVTFLLGKGAHINAITDENREPLQLAASNGHLDVVNALILEGATVNTSDINGTMPLHCAIRTGNIEMVETLLKHGAYVNTTGATPLHVAAECGNLEIVTALLKYKADIHVKLNNNTTPLYQAAGGGHEKIVKLFIKKGADVNAKGDNNLTALLAAITNGHKDVAQILIQNKAEVNTHITSGVTAMHIAASMGNNDIMDLLIQNKAIVNARSMSGGTPLHDAVQEGHGAAVDFLIKNKAEVNAEANDGITPLHVAVLQGNKKIVTLLINNGALVNLGVIGSNSPPPLHTAAMAGHKDIVEILIAKDAIVDDIKSYHLTPLHCAIKYNHKAIVEVLLKNGAKVSIGDFADWSLPVVRGYTDIVKILLNKNKKYATLKVSKSYTLLHLAAKMGHKKIVNALIANGADVNAMFTDNETPLLCAAQEGFEEIVEILIARGAEVTSKYTLGNSPLDEAARRGHSKVVKVLLDNKADIDINDNRSNGPIRLAVAGAHLEMVKILLQYMEVNIDARDTDGFTLLQLASQTNCNLEIVKYLVDEGSDINATVDGYKAIHLAAGYGHKETVKYFVSKGLSINELSAVHQTLLHCAARQGQLEVVNYLIDQRADVNAKTTNGYTPVHTAAVYGYADVMETLLKNGGTYNAVNNSYKTPLEMAKNKDVIKLLKTTEKLFEAVKSNNASAVQSYIESGAVVNAKNAEGETPLHYAALKGYDEVVNILLQNKANPNVLTNEKFTPLHYAAEVSHLKVVKILLSYDAVYNPVTDSDKTPSDLTVDESVFRLFKLISDLFKNIEIDNCRVINYLDNIKDIETVKAIMCARNRENKTLLLAAMQSNFSKLQQLENIAQGDISNQISSAAELYELEDYQKSLCILEGALRKKKEILGSNSLSTLNMQKSIVDILIKQGDYQEALKTCKEIFQKEKEILGLNNNIILRTKTKFASIMLGQGKNEKAFKISKEVYQKQKTILAPNDADILITQTCMGLALESQEKYEEALDIFRSVHKNTDPANYRESLLAQFNIAMVLANQGNDEEALKIYNEMLEKAKVDLCINHPLTLSVLFNIAVLTGKKKKYNKALKIYYEILNIQKKVLKPNHPKILRTQYNIGCILFFQRKWIHSLKAFKEGLHQRKEILGANHPLVLDILNNIKAINFNLKLQGKEPSKILQFLQKDLIIAVNAGDIKTIKSLLEDGADVNNVDICGRPALHHAVSNGNVDVVNILLEHGADVTQITIKGNTALHIATSQGNTKIVEILLQHLGPDRLSDFINAKTTGNGAAALHVSAKKGFLDITLSLLKRGAIYNITDNEQKTPLDLCTDQNITDLLQLIKGLFEEAETGDGETIPKLKAVKPDEYVDAVENACNTERMTILQVIIINKFKIVAAKHVGMLKGLPDMTLSLTMKIIDKR